MATDGVCTDGSLLCFNGMMSRLSCCGESVLQMLSWYGNSGTTLARATVGAVGGVVSMLQTVDSPDVKVICICNGLRTLSCS